MYKAVQSHRTILINEFMPAHWAQSKSNKYLKNTVHYRPIKRNVLIDLNVNPLFTVMYTRVIHHVNLSKSGMIFMENQFFPDRSFSLSLHTKSKTIRQGTSPAFCSNFVPCQPCCVATIPYGDLHRDKRVLRCNSVYISIYGIGIDSVLDITIYMSIPRL